ncbi:hypothetical protein G7Y89_g10926 [Cudoniella acicularis]|uniref:F-box domain-containing protein n=1 Tax=Cudoniella acicularis TaxID=354080 RepID=A0A8H4REI3_9HELO|nr:hypothetical protein G7Y89_g10926 [Cudoniella acicularis]
MAPLLTLSNELLYTICQLTDCEDLLSLAATNHRLHLISKPIKEYHTTQWAKFQSLNDSPPTDPWFWHHLTLSLLSNPLSASYIRSIHTTSTIHKSLETPSSNFLVKTWDTATHKQKLLPNRMVLVPLAAGQRKISRLASPSPSRNHVSYENFAFFSPFEEAIKSFPWLSPHQAHALKADLRKSAPQPSIHALLLPLLPNLRTLKIDSSSSSAQHYLELAVQHAALAHSLSIPCSAFANLRTLDVTSEVFTSSPNNRESLNCDASVGTVEGGPYSLDFLAAFMALPSLRTLSASRITAQTFTRSPLLPPSNVTHLSLYDQDISSSAFASLLSDGAPLISVKLDVRAYAEFFDDGMVVDILLSNSRGSLQRFELKRETETNVTGLTSGICLSGFEVLRVVDNSWT